MAKSAGSPALHRSNYVICGKNSPGVEGLFAELGHLEVTVKTNQNKNVNHDCHPGGGGQSVLILTFFLVS